MLINEIPYYMARAAILTVIIEICASLIIGIKNKKDLLNVILVNVMTNPLVNAITIFFNFYFGILGRNICLTILEILVVISEGFVYKKYLKFNKINPYVVSLILNTFSYFLGEVINLL